MNIGICFGGYCPLHRGHLDLIMKSKKTNDFTFVIVCGHDGEEYHKCMECASEHRQLAEWLRELKAYREALKNGDLRGCRNCKYTDVDILDYPCATCEKTDLWEVNADE